jgi:excisionase family DNA binding protein
MPPKRLTNEGGQMDRKALSLTEAADALGIHRHTLRQLVEDGRLRSVRVGRRYLIPVAEIDRFLAQAAKAV